MEIKYMKELERNPDLAPSIGKRKGIDEAQIQKLEGKYNNGKEFPKAFREYLFLAGIMGNTGVVDEDWDDVREYCEEDMETWGNKLNRLFFVFDKLDSQYSIFFLDEDKEDPDVYIFNASWDINDTEPLLKMSFTGTFSNMINTAIYHIKNDLPF